MSRFDPHPTAPYGTCAVEGCNAPLSTREEADGHMRATFDASGASKKGHGIRITNPSRAERIARFAEMEASDALDSAEEEFTRELSRVLDDGEVTREELDLAVKQIWADIDWVDTWTKYADGDDD